MKHVFVALLLIALPAWSLAEEAAAPANETSADEKPAGWRVTNVQATGRIDYQLMHMKATEVDPMRETRGELMAAELETTATINNGQRDVLDLALQWPYVTEMAGVDGRGKAMHFGNVYGSYKLGLGKPNIRVGQFVAPFGNLPYYETHTRPLQSLYPQSLGVRIDRGVSVEGFAGPYDYAVAAMGGNGARSDNDRSPMLTGRVARRFDLDDGGTLTAGVSALYGREMPRFSPLVDPLMEEAMMDMPLEHSLTFTDKTRVALDAEYSRGPATWRAELVGGRDADGPVNGQFLQWNRALSDRTEVTAQAARWEQPTGNRLRLGASYGYRLNDRTTLRASVERGLGHVPGEDRQTTTVGLQMSLELGRLFE